ncbi:MAG: FHA domain-containing protein [Thermoplasmataceae archaeon]
MVRNGMERGEIRIVKGDATIAKLGTAPVIIGREQIEPFMTEKLKAASISREHIKIAQRDGRIYIEDFKPSKNGTWIIRDGQAVEITGKKGETELFLTDEIILSKVVTLKLKQD